MDWKKHTTRSGFLAGLLASGYFAADSVTRDGPLRRFCSTVWSTVTVTTPAPPGPPPPAPPPPVPLGTSLPARLAASAGANRYVNSAIGSNGNDGTANDAGHAWATVQFAIDTVTAGMIVNVAACTAEALLISNKNYASTVTIQALGGMPKLHNFWIEAGGGAQPTRNIRIKGFEFDGSATAVGGSGFPGFGCNIKPNGTGTLEHIEIQDCWSHDHGHAIPGGANSSNCFFVGGSLAGPSAMTDIQFWNCVACNPGSETYVSGDQTTSATLTATTSTPTNVPEIYYGEGVLLNGVQTLSNSTLNTKGSTWGNKILSTSGKCVINGQTITYTGSTNDGLKTTSLTGCTGGSGSAPDNTAIYGGPGTVFVYNNAGTLQVVTFTGRGVGQFTGCGGWSGTLGNGAAITDADRNEDHGWYISDTGNIATPDVLIANCIAYDIRSGYGYQIYPDSNRVLVVNSGAYGNLGRSGFIIGQETANHATDCHLKNCWSVRTDQQGATAGFHERLMSLGASPTNSWDNCLSFNNPGGAFDADVGGALTSSNKITTDPLFTNVTNPHSVVPPSSSQLLPSARNFRPTPGSPMYAAGAAAYTPTTDFTGALRQQATIGPFLAAEESSASLLRPQGMGHRW